MTKDFDVAILGSGMAGTMLASILARHGVKTVVFDAGVHPRFAVGESTVPQTSQMHTLLSLKFDVPELHEIGLGSPDSIRKKIGLSCGIKRIFGFAYHSPHAEHDPREALQVGNVWRDENHLFRQDVDAYLVQVAIRYGATILQGVRIEDVEIRPEGAQLQTSAGAFAVQYVVDGSGFRSVLTQRFGLRENPTRLRHHSRTLFTHMIDVVPFEECTQNHLSIGWSKGTLHHVFKGGWVWVIPFNNWEGSTNQLVSVGLTVDPRVHPARNDLTAEEEFFTFIDQFPSIARQFKKARAVRPWVRTPRLQYSSVTTVGQRYCLTAHAAGFIDPLFSRGLINNAEVIYAIAEPLISAAKEKDYSEERFAHLDTLQRQILDYADRVVEGSFVSWSDFDLWNAWMRVWSVGLGSLESNLGGYVFTYNFPEKRFRLLEDPLFSPFEDPGYKSYFNTCYDIISRYRDGEVLADAATASLFKVLGEYDFQMALPNKSNSHCWALKNPLSRDFFIGKPELHERWERRAADPHLL